MIFTYVNSIWLLQGGVLLDASLCTIVHTCGMVILQSEGRQIFFLPDMAYTHIPLLTHTSRFHAPVLVRASLSHRIYSSHVFPRAGKRNPTSPTTNTIGAFVVLLLLHAFDGDRKVNAANSAVPVIGKVRIA